MASGVRNWYGLASVTVVTRRASCCERKRPGESGEMPTLGLAHESKFCHSIQLS